MQEFYRTSRILDCTEQLMVSFDSTLKANLSVGLPLDLQIYETDSFAVDDQTRIESDDAYYQAVSQGWGDALRQALMHLPAYERT